MIEYFPFETPDVGYQLVSGKTLTQFMIGEVAGEKGNIERVFFEIEAAVAPPPLAYRLDVIQSSTAFEDCSKAGPRVSFDLLAAKRKPRARELSPHDGKHIGGRSSFGVDVDEGIVDHVLSKNHGLQEKSAVRRKEVSHRVEEALVNGILFPLLPFLDRAEVLECTDAGNRAEIAESVRPDRPAIHRSDIESGPGARCRLSAGQGQTLRLRAKALEELQQGSPSAPHVEDSRPFPDTQHIRNEFVLSFLRLLQRHREVTVVFCTAEIPSLTHAQTENPVDEGIRVFHLLPAGHGIEPISEHLRGQWGRLIFGLDSSITSSYAAGNGPSRP
jgi:hypothetical protein